MIETVGYDDLDLVLFKPEDDSSLHKPALPVYKILIVDDEEEVHKITRLTLRNLVFEDHEIVFLSAYNLSEAKTAFDNQEDIAVVLIDVVMETNSAGLDLVKYIRDTLRNRTTRIILRTGQPGAAPEDKVILDYDINDYKSKTELTSQKLFTSTIACIRGYRDIIQIDRNRRGLKCIIDSTAHLFDFQDRSLKMFLNNLLEQLVSLHNLSPVVGLGRSGNPSEPAGFMLMKVKEDFMVSAAKGPYESYIGQNVYELGDSTIFEAVLRLAHENRDQMIFGDGFYISYHIGHEDTVWIIYMRCSPESEQDLVRILLSNITLALDNFMLNRNIQSTQREIISTLSEIVEKRDLSTANHIKRVSEYAFVMARNLGLDHENCKRMKIACMMHDVGKIGISDSILLKPTILSAEEFEKIKEHSNIGYRLLENSSLPIMKVAAEIALSHHERWDGNGYPNQLKEKDIPLNPRIIAVLDVFDALTHKRIYKEPWSLEETLTFIRTQSGQMFDPRLVDLFFESMDEILEIWHTYPDEPE